MIVNLVVAGENFEVLVMPEVWVRAEAVICGVGGSSPADHIRSPMRQTFKENWIHQHLRKMRKKSVENTIHIMS